MTTPTRTATRDRTRATGADLRAAFVAASSWLNANAERVDALNVFPVPDGDTGTNMSLTLQAAVDGIRPLPNTTSAGEVARKLYEAAMLGARGNSGVILSQSLRGFADALQGAEVVTPRLLAAALAQAATVAYTAVSKPIEGTILTVARKTGEAAQQAAETGRSLTDVLEQALHAATEAVAATPSQMEVLRKAGVVDSGGEGYRVIVEAAWMWSTGRSLEQGADTRPHSRALIEAVEEEEGPAYGFCTEFLLRECDLPVADVKATMEGLGESVIAVGDADLLRVHVHTLRPGQALEFAVDHGTLVKVKVDNMQLQRDAFAATTGGAGGGAADAPSASSIGVVAVAAGDGLLNVFRSLGATVVKGGQTMNPSVQDILAAVNSSGYKSLIILPNNSNIVMTANNVNELTPHAVEVVATSTVPQGICALLAFNFQADIESNVAAMQQAAHAVHTIEVTTAVRDAEVDGVTVRAGQAMGMYDGTVTVTADTPEEALLQAIGQAPLDALEIVTIYFGANMTEDGAHAIASKIREAHEGLAVEVVAGGQPHYPFVVSLE